MPPPPANRDVGDSTQIPEEVRSSLPGTTVFHRKVILLLGTATILLYCAGTNLLCYSSKKESLDDGQQQHTRHLSTWKNQVLQAKKENKKLEWKEDTVIDGMHAHDQFGYSLSISDQGYLVGGSPFCGTANKGSVQVFQKTSKFKAIGGAIEGVNEGDQFGFSVSLSRENKWFAVGAPFESSTGAVHTFRISGSRWRAGDVLKGKEPNDHFGSSVAMSSSGNRLLIGAPGDANKVGYIRLYDLNTSFEKWRQLGSDFFIGGPGNEFGSTVALSGRGDIAAVGIPKKSTVQVFRYSFSGGWKKHSEDLKGKIGDEFGHSISISDDGDTLAVGTGASNYVSVFDYFLGNYVQIGNDIIGQEGFGKSVSLTGDGRNVLIGSPYDNSKKGVACVFEYSLGGWTKRGTDVLGQAPGDMTGWSVSATKNLNFFAVGAPGRTSGDKENCGDIRVFK